jgi:energy-coupling factor transporter ATP-binding protein EcfA2
MRESKRLQGMKAYEGTPFRLSRVEIENVRCFEKIAVGLDGSHGPKSWAVILGDNGVGKTTLLRCIALGMCDESSASGLLREIYGDWNRIADDVALEGKIRLTFCTDDGPATITTTIEPRTSGYSVVRQEPHYPGLPSKDFPWDGIFACGYGSARRSFGSKDVADYATIDAVYTLFNYDESLQNPELVLRRIRDTLRSQSSTKDSQSNNPEELASLLNALSAVLMLSEGSIELGNKGLMLSGPWGNFQPIGGLGDGFQATLSWLTDLIGWALLYGDERPLSELTGIVLVDEIEQHLHPRWQRQIIGLLKRHFANLQFITTTHTPMCAIGTTDLPEGDCELIKLEREGGAVVAKENLRPPRGQRADQVLTSFLFELPTTSDDDTLGKIVRLNELQTNSGRSNEEERELEALRDELHKIFAEEETPFETVVRSEVQAAIEKKNIEKMSNEAVRLEVLHILRSLE